jgi:hypothetical protein
MQNGFIWFVYRLGQENGEGEFKGSSMFLLVNLQTAVK